MVVLYAAKYDEVSKVVNISGRFDLEKGIQGRLGRDFLQRIKQDGYIDVKNKRGKLSNISSFYFKFYVALTCPGSILSTVL